MHDAESQLETLAIQQEELHVTKSFLPPLEEYKNMLDQLWATHKLTNNGPYLKEFESALRSNIENQQITMVSNGTVALQIMLRATGVKEEVITTPFSYVATTSSLVWENCKPVFADISPHSLNIDPANIEACITPKTTAILATHVFGNPCEVDALQALADKHGLKLLFDAAHAFGVRYNGKSLMNYGDASTLSFHATKLFHSVEGGAIVCKQPDVFERCNYMRNFGHNGQEAFQGLGINGKMSELHAAMGALNFRYLDDIMKPREASWLYYAKALLGNSNLELQAVTEGTEMNFSYFSVVFESEEALLAVRAQMHKLNIYPRRYFYPALNSLPYVSQECPLAESVAKRILCLPLYSGMPTSQQDAVLSAIHDTIG